MIYVIIDLKSGQMLGKSISCNEESKHKTIATFDRLKKTQDVSLFIANCVGKVLAKVA